MILHTIISPADVLYNFSEEQNVKKSEEICSTDPFVYLERDEYYKNYIKMRK